MGKRTISGWKLIEALESNFEGREDVRHMLINAPCYGNNDPYADTIARDIDRAGLDFTHRYAKELGWGCIWIFDMCRSPHMCPSARW